jgi:two-component system, NarL family, response regulator NreC
VLVLDLSLPGGRGIEAIGELCDRAPVTEIVVLTMEDNPVFVQRALLAGALGFVLKDQADSELRARSPPSTSPPTSTGRTASRPRRPEGGAISSGTTLASGGTSSTRTPMMTRVRL